MEFTVVDAGVAVVTLLSGILAYSRGVTREIFAIAGWVAAAVVASYVAPMVEPLIREAPFVGEKLADSCVISIAVAFTIVLAISLLVLSIFTPLIAGLVLDSALGGLDRMLGFLFGIARGLLLIAIVYLIYTKFSGIESWPPLDNAASRVLFEESATLVEQNLPDQVPGWFQERIDALTANCSDELPAASVPDATDLPATTPQPGAGANTGANTGSAGTNTTGN
jgi:membrane protein required for colicin V production